MQDARSVRRLIRGVSGCSAALILRWVRGLGPAVAAVTCTECRTRAARGG
jgi:hypothetical protein